MNDQIETIVNIELQKLVPFRDHPFQVRDDDEMRMLTESVSSVGVLVPAIVRPIEDEQYEIIAGHRRHYASGLAGLSTIPCIVRDVDRDTATVMMVDSNFQREEILPSERAKAYQMKLNAIKRQGARTDLTSDQVGQKLERKSSRDLISENSPDSSSQIQRYLRLNALLPELLQMVDEGRIAPTPASELSFLTEKEQSLLILTIESEQATPSLSQAQRIFPCCQLLLFLSEAGHRGNRFSIGELVQGLPCSFIEKNFRFMRLSKIPLVFCFHIRSKHFLVGKVLAGVVNELIDCFQPLFGCEECVVFLLLVNLSGRKKRS